MRFEHFSEKFTSIPQPNQRYSIVKVHNNENWQCSIKIGVWTGATENWSGTIWFLWRHGAPVDAHHLQSRYTTLFFRALSITEKRIHHSQAVFYYQYSFFSGELKKGKKKEIHYCVFNCQFPLSPFSNIHFNRPLVLISHDYGRWWYNPPRIIEYLCSYSIKTQWYGWSVRAGCHRFCPPQHKRLVL